MTSRDFVYWLQGFFEISNPETITPEQIETIKKHLALVFVHEIDPSMGPDEHQEKLDKVHNEPAPSPLDSTRPPVYRC
jgi:hypothetical protein